MRSGEMEDGVMYPFVMSGCVGHLIRMTSKVQ